MRPGGSRRQKPDVRRDRGVRASARLEYLLLPGPTEHSAFSPPRAKLSAMDPVYGIPLIAALVLAWLAARHVINKARQQRELLRRQRLRSRSKYRDAPETVSSRSDMRSTDAPVTIADNIRKRERAPKEDSGADKPPGRRG